MITGIIYKYVSPSNKVYIGQTKDEEKRRNKFLNNKVYTKPNSKIDKARNKYNPKNFQYTVIYKKNYLNEEDASFDLDLMEIYYIAKFDSFRNGYNSTTGGDGSNNHLVSEETRNKMREAQTGKILTEQTKLKLKKSSMGRKHTEEAKSKISKARLGQKLSDETKEKISSYRKGKFCGSDNPFFGKHHTEETKQKISQNNAKKRAVLQIDKTTNEIIAEWESIREAARQLNIKNQNISACCVGKTKSCGGFIWKFK